MNGNRAAALFLLVVGPVVSARAEIQLNQILVDGDQVRGQWGSKHSVITQVGRNHFKMELGDQPGIPHQAAFSAFHIRASAKGNTLRMDVVRGKLHNGSYREYFFSWSTDKVNWHPVDWQGSSLVFPEFPEDQVWVACQVPVSYNQVVAMTEVWKKNPCVSVHEVGRSFEGLNLFRIVVTDDTSPHARKDRWVHYVANQHGLEHNAQWRIIGMLQWALSDEAADFRKRSICHFVVMMAPDSPGNGWMRANAEGTDMNRSYLPPGSGGLPTDDWRQRIREAVDRFADHPALHGYMVRDEPGADLYPQLGRIVTEFERLDPRHTVSINLFPVHATAEQLQTADYVEYLERYLRTVKPPFLSYDHYPLLRNGSDRPDFFLNLELARAAGAKYKTPVWTVVLSGWGQHFRKPTPAELRWQVYGALAYGIKGVAYFAYWPANDGYTSVVDYEGRPQSLYEPMAKLNAKVLAMQRILLDATSTAVYHSGTAIPRGCRRLDAKAAPLEVPGELPLVIGLFSKGPKGRYAMIVNRNYRRPVTLPVTLRAEVQEAALISANGNAFRRASEARDVEITLPAGGATLLRLHMHTD